jgi:hypothetical protein
LPGACNIRRGLLRAVCRSRECAECRLSVSLKGGDGWASLLGGQPRESVLNELDLRSDGTQLPLVDAQRQAGDALATEVLQKLLADASAAVERSLDGLRLLLNSPQLVSRKSDAGAAEVLPPSREVVDNGAKRSSQVRQFAELIADGCDLAADSVKERLLRVDARRCPLV